MEHTFTFFILLLKVITVSSNNSCDEPDLGPFARYKPKKKYKVGFGHNVKQFVFK